ncbi:MAG: aromatic ring-hydroxylating dioxygenase subunit alpha, partial [Alphaproteobacteria bacterium]|nr:aromatic ring-hydroxylating dioxygenase subunit alpha [Alphaproteobacteria bacterium]
MNVEDPKKMKPGEARSEAESVQDILQSEKNPVPESLQRVTYRYMGSEDLPTERWTSQEFHDLEMEKIWSKVWQMACREEEIPEVGDYIVYDIGDYSFIVTRVADDDIRAYYNACLHRGTQLRASGTEGNVPQFRCPFHGWTWNLDGSLAEIPCEWDFPHVKAEEFNLPQVRAETWGGFVFINMDENAEPLLDFLGDIVDEFEPWGYEDKVKIAHVMKRVDMNWKVGVEAFIESYHVVATHPQIMPSTADANTQYDVDPEANFNRMITAMGVPSPHLGEIPEQKIVDAMTGRSYRLGVEFDEFKVPEGQTARQFMAELRRQAIAEQFNQDYSHSTDSEMLDAIQYWVFPNFFPWGGYGTNIVYRFRPEGNNPDSAWLEVMLIADYDKSKPKPEPAPLRILGEDEDWDQAEDLIGGLAPVFQQDMQNMPRVQKGMKTLKKGITLGNYQESRVRHLHH